MESLGVVGGILFVIYVLFRVLGSVLESVPERIKWFLVRRWAKRNIPSLMRCTVNGFTGLILQSDYEKGIKKRRNLFVGMIEAPWWRRSTWMISYARIKSRECIVPSIERVYVFPNGAEGLGVLEQNAFVTNAVFWVPTKNLTEKYTDLNWAYRYFYGKSMPTQITS